MELVLLVFGAMLAAITYPPSKPEEKKKDKKPVYTLQVFKEDEK